MSGAQVTACCGTGVRDQAPGSGDPGVECVGCGRDNPTLVAMPRCIGFGDLEGRCENPADANDTRLWCMRCENARRAHISAQMEKIAQGFES